MVGLRDPYDASFNVKDMIIVSALKADIITGGLKLFVNHQNERLNGSITLLQR